MAINIKALTLRIKKNQDKYCLTGLPDSPWYTRAFHTTICFLHVMYAETRATRTFMRASSATYTTTLAIIPFLVVGGSFIALFNHDITSNDIVNYLQDFIGPIANPAVTKFLSESLSRALEIGLGPVGIISLLITTVMLFISIQDSVNDIWHVKRKQKFYIRVLLFYAIVTLGPVLVSVSVYQATQLMGKLGAITPTEDDYAILKYIRTAAVSMLGCLVLYKFLPNTKVQFKYTFIPAIITALIFEVTKFAFSLYMQVAFANSYRVLYGAIGFVPISLLWIYILWTLMFLGFQACYCVQNFSQLKLATIYDSDSDNESDLWIFLGPFAPIEVIAALVRELENGKTPVRAEELALSCQYPIQAIDAILSRLVQYNFVNVFENDGELLYVLAHPLDGLDLNAIMDVFDETTPRTIRYAKLHNLIKEQNISRQSHFQTLNGHALRELPFKPINTTSLPDAAPDCEPNQTEKVESV